ncbi:hypothetical protein I4U23_022640 [Adineta vaga]|nr:hypothetical protein I4U23_022640 [Adineta vaga]
MSSDYDLNTLLSSISKGLNKFGGPILIFIGTISCILNLCVFSRKILRKNRCSIYLIATNVSSIFLIYTSTLYATLANGYSIDLTTYHLILFRLRFYTMFLFEILPPSYLILASIDRILLTSHHASTRQKSTIRLACISIIIVTVFWSAVHIHSLIFMNLRMLAPGFNACLFQPTLYLAVMSYYPLIVKGVLIPSLMITFGLWTVKNVRTIGRVAPIPVTVNGIAQNNGSRSGHSKDQQLIRMLLTDITIYIIFNIIQSIIAVYQQITQNQSKTYLETRIEGFVFIIGLSITSIPFCIGCYTNLFVSKLFNGK